MTDDELQGHGGTCAVAEDVGGLDTQLVDSGGDVVRHDFKRHGAINIGGASVALKLNSDDLATLGQARQQLPERRANG